MRAIILAAGQGKRMLPLTKEIPKCLLKCNETTILGRIMNQLASFDFNDITVVVGYKKDQVIGEIGKILKNNVTIAQNDRYEEDTNILSLSLALSKNVAPFLVIEADTILGDKCFEVFAGHFNRRQSIWYTNGYFHKNQVGGILKNNERNEVVDIRIVPEYSNKYKDYKKLANVLMVGENEIDLYSEFLFKACEENIRQYYLMPWINHLSRLKCYEYDIMEYKVTAFNTPSEYFKALNSFNH